MSDKSKRSVRKTIRFDKDMYDSINLLASRSGFHFSKEIKVLIALSIGKDVASTLPVSFTDDDKKILHEILVLYSRSATNVNQAAHVLNSINQLSWLDLSHDDLVRSLGGVSDNLKSVNYNFNKFNLLVDSIINSYKR